MSNIGNFETVSGVNEQIIVPAATQNFNPPVETETATSTVTTQAPPPASFFEKVEEETKVEVLKVVDAIDDFVGTEVVAPVEAVAEKVETDAKAELVASVPL